MDASHLNFCCCLLLLLSSSSKLLRMSHSTIKALRQRTQQWPWHSRRSQLATTTTTTTQQQQQQQTTTTTTTTYTPVNSHSHGKSTILMVFASKDEILMGHVSFREDKSSEEALHVQNPHCFPLRQFVCLTILIVWWLNFVQKKLMVGNGRLYLMTGVELNPLQYPLLWAFKTKLPCNFGGSGQTCLKHGSMENNIPKMACKPYPNLILI